MTNPPRCQPPLLKPEERTYYRDRLRSARYSALADAEGFGEICYAIETLGQRLDGREGTMGTYRHRLRRLSTHSPVLSELSLEPTSTFSNFDTLFETLLVARNDAMHSGAYARHATAAAVELCVGLEEALMEQESPRRVLVRDFMVKSPIDVLPWQLVAQARQLMLTHSFSFLPVRIEEKWQLVSEFSLAKYLHQKARRKVLLATSIEHAAKLDSGHRLELIDAEVIKGDSNVTELIEASELKSRSFLWLVTDSREGLIGVLSPFELM